MRTIKINFVGADGHHITTHRAKARADKESARLRRWPVESLSPQDYDRLNFYNSALLHLLIQSHNS